ncbi:MAG: hypothetical protein QXT25_01895 [Candidatus Anstonellaceae archaeon]
MSNMQSNVYPKPAKAVQIDVNNCLVGTIARRKISAFRKFLLESEVYPEEVRKKWAEHKNTLQESLLMARIHYADQLIYKIQTQLSQIEPILSRKETWVKQVSLEISMVESEIAKLQNLQKRTADLVSSVLLVEEERKRQEAEISENFKRVGEKFSYIELKPELVDRRIISPNLKAHLKKNIRSLAAQSEEIMPHAGKESDDLSIQLGLTNGIFDTVGAIYPDYPIFIMCKFLLEQKSPFDVFLQQAKAEGIAVNSLQDLLTLSPSEKIRAKEMCNEIVSAKKNLSISLKKLKNSVLLARKSLQKDIFAPEAILESESTLSEASKFISFAETFYISQMNAFEALSKYFIAQEKCKALEERKKRLSEKLHSSYEYWRLKKLHEILSSRLKRIKTANEEAKIALDKLSQKIYLKEYYAKIRKQNASTRLEAYVMRLEQDENKAQASAYENFHVFTKSKQWPMQKDLPEARYQAFISAAKEQFKDFLKKYPHMSSSFEATLFHLARIFIEDGGHLNRNKLNGFFQSRIKQEYLPNSNAVLIRLGMNSSNEYRFLIDITDSRQPLILVAAIKQETRRFLKRIVQGNYSSERSKALNDGRGNLFLMLQ